jgi:hypothetical protein
MTLSYSTIITRYFMGSPLACSELTSPDARTDGAHVSIHRTGLTTVVMTENIIWGITLCMPVKTTNISEEHGFSILRA